MAVAWKRLAYYDDVLKNIVEDTTPQLGGDLDTNLKNIAFNPTSIADHSFHGKVVTGTAGENLTIGQLAYFKSDGKFWKTDADAEATTKGLLAIATGTINADASGTFLLWGWIRDDSLFDLTVGAPYFVGLTGGAIETSPSASGDFPRVIGYGWTADIFFFCPDNSWIEIT